MGKRGKTGEHNKGRFGPLHSRWKGGRYISHGYVTININGQKMLEHRRVMAEHLGHPLTKDEIVHHINKIKTDNKARES